MEDIRNLLFPPIGVLMDEDDETDDPALVEDAIKAARETADDLPDEAPVEVD